jgi:antitoxin (DNA-binding transcriptional repressor) of toxin-antitoxin stability system
MREITATEAARGFSALLDALERDGETFVITRGGRPVARIEPTVGTTGQALKALLRHDPADLAWAAELEAVRGVLTTEEPPWPG